MKTKPVYTLSEVTISSARQALQSRLWLAWRQYQNLHGTERAEQRAFVRKLTYSLRQLWGYQIAKEKLNFHRNFMRKLPRSVRRMMRRARKLQKTQSKE
jgi:hypothetical protein